MADRVSIRDDARARLVALLRHAHALSEHSPSALPSRRDRAVPRAPARVADDPRAAVRGGRRRRPARALRAIYLDTAQADNAPALEATLALTDAAKIVFGTDWPYAALPREDQTRRPGSTRLAATRAPASITATRLRSFPGLSTLSAEMRRPTTTAALRAVDASGEGGDI